MTRLISVTQALERERERETERDRERRFYRPSCYADLRRVSFTERLAGFLTVENFDLQEELH
jgi:hypothetical protein